MTKQQVAAVESSKPSLVKRFAARFGVDEDKMLGTLKLTAFKVGNNGSVSNEQMMALLVVADQYGLNPWTREIYAFPDKGGIVPVVGVDGWSRIINSHEQFDGVDFEQDDDSCTCTIYRKDRAHPTKVTEFSAECRRDTGPWKSHPRRMLRHKTLIQCARLAFGFVGIFDEDEAQRIVERDVTHVSEVVEPPRLRDQLRAKPVSATDTVIERPDNPITYAEIAAMLTKAKAQDVRDQAADLISAIEDEQQKIELSQLYAKLSEQETA